jgi:hypothetical protein
MGISCTKIQIGKWLQYGVKKVPAEKIGTLLQPSNLHQALFMIIGLSLVIRNTIKFTGCYRKKTT